MCERRVLRLGADVPVDRGVGVVRRLRRVVLVVVVMSVLVAGLVVAGSRPVGAQSVQELCGSPSVAERRPFTDVLEGYYGADYIACLKHLGLVSGRGDGSFGPADELTRAQMATIVAGLWELLSGRGCPSGGVPFSDVDRSSPHYEGISCLYNLGFVSGKTATMFAPGASLTAAQLTRIMGRVFEEFLPASLQLNTPLSRAFGTCRGHEPEELRVCVLWQLNVIADSMEALSDEPVIRAQVAVNTIGLWIYLTNYISSQDYAPRPPSVPEDYWTIQVAGGDVTRGKPPVWSPDGSRIAYSRGDTGQYGVWVTSADANGEYRYWKRQSPTKLADEGYSPAWHPDGDRLAFGRTVQSYDTELGRLNVDYEIQVVDLDGSAPRLVASVRDADNTLRAGSQPDNLAWHPDGDRLAFQGVHDIYVVGTNGASLTRIAKLRSTISDIAGRVPGELDVHRLSHPKWSHDGTRLYFTEAVYGSATEGVLTNLWVVDADGHNPTQLTGSSLGARGVWSIRQYYDFSVSPDDRHVAFSSRYGVYVMDTDGGNLRRATTFPSRFSSPGVGYWHPPPTSFVYLPNNAGVAWSSDGEFIATTMIYDYDQKTDILVMRPDGSDLRRLTTDGDVKDSPLWSPGGDRIAFRVKRLPQLSAFETPPIDQVIKVTQLAALSRFTPESRAVAEPRNLTSNSVDDVQPVWSPDGNRIAFVRYTKPPHLLSYPEYSVQDQKSGEIYVMDADGRNQRRLTNNRVADYYPVWSPDSEQVFFVRGGEELYVIDVDTGRERQVLVRGDQRGDWLGGSFGISPDGQTLIYVGTHSGPRTVSRIYLTNVDGTRTRPLIQEHLIEEYAEDLYVPWRWFSEPRFSPDGKRVAFTWTTGEFDLLWNLHVVDTDGSNPHLLVTNYGAPLVSWDWLSPDRIAFIPDNTYGFYPTIDPASPTRKAHGRFDSSVWTIRRDGSDLQQAIGSPDLTDFCDEDDFSRYMEWLAENRQELLASVHYSLLAHCLPPQRSLDYVTASPDSNRVIFTERGGWDTASISNADGSNVQQLITNLDYIYALSWSPDGTRALFVSRRGSWQDEPDDFEIFVVDAPQTS